MSVILDALRKVEREKRPCPPMMTVDRRALEQSPTPSDGFLPRRNPGLMAAAALAAFAGGFCLAAVSAGPNPLRPAAAEAMTMNDTAVTVSTAVGSKDTARYGVEETPAADSLREQGAGPLGEKGEISPRSTAGPVLPPSVNRNEPAGIEPPVRPRAQAAPAPVIFLDGIVFHGDPARRAALLRAAGGDGVLLNIGGRLGGCRVDAIAETSVTLALAGGKKIELALE